MRTALVVEAAPNTDPRVLLMDAPQLPQAVEVEARQPHKLWIRLDDGVCGVVDLARWSTRGRLTVWSDVTDFKTAYLRPYGAVAWVKDDALKLDRSAMCLDLTGKCFEDLNPRPWPELAV